MVQPHEFTIVTTIAYFTCSYHPQSHSILLCPTFTADIGKILANGNWTDDSFRMRCLVKLSFATMVLLICKLFVPLLSYDDHRVCKKVTISRDIIDIADIDFFDKCGLKRKKSMPFSRMSRCHKVDSCHERIAIRINHGGLCITNIFMHVIKRYKCFNDMHHL